MGQTTSTPIFFSGFHTPVSRPQSRMTKANPNGYMNPDWIRRILNDTCYNGRMKQYFRSKDEIRLDERDCSPKQEIIHEVDKVFSDEEWSMIELRRTQRSCVLFFKNGTEIADLVRHNRKEMTSGTEKKSEKIFYT